MEKLDLLWMYGILSPLGLERVLELKNFHWGYFFFFWNGLGDSLLFFPFFLVSFFCLFWCGIILVCDLVVRCRCWGLAGER